MRVRISMAVRSGASGTTWMVAQKVAPPASARLGNTRCTEDPNPSGGTVGMSGSPVISWSA
jgi:hypothetical protein